MNRALLEHWQSARHAGIACVMMTDLRRHTQSLIIGDTLIGDMDIDETILRHAHDALQKNCSEQIETNIGPVFLHVFNPLPRLFIIGAVHIAQPLAAIATIAEFKVTIIDPRTAFATASRFPNLTVLTDWPDEAMARLAPDATTAIVTLTHDPKLDDPALLSALNSPAFYIGCLGSQKTHDARLARLVGHGMAPEQLTRLHGPIGLSIGARKPAEIAIAIMAQLLQVRQNRARQP